jgi:hypothetical protein
MPCGESTNFTPGLSCALFIVYTGGIQDKFKVAVRGAGYAPSPTGTIMPILLDFIHSKTFLVGIAPIEQEGNQEQ